MSFFLNKFNLSSSISKITVRRGWDKITSGHLKVEIIIYQTKNIINYYLFINIFARCKKFWKPLVQKDFKINLTKQTIIKCSQETLKNLKISNLSKNNLEKPFKKMNKNLNINY